jgi:hypothetical protein
VKGFFFKRTIIAKKKILYSLLENEEGDMMWIVFMSNVKKQLIHLNIIVKFYFLSKFLASSMPYKLPILSQKSSLLTEEYLCLMYLSNAFVQSTQKMSLIYNSHEPARSFRAMADCLINYSGPTIILFQHEELIDGRPHSYVYGGFTQARWKNSSEYQGNSETYVFTLYPKFKIFQALPGKKGLKNFSYLSLDDYGGLNGLGTKKKQTKFS